MNIEKIVEEYNNIFGQNHYKICEGKKCICHKKVKHLITKALTSHTEAIREEVERMRNKRVVDYSEIDKQKAYNHCIDNILNLEILKVK